MNTEKLSFSALKIARRASERILSESDDNPEKAILYTLANNGPQSLAKIVKTLSTFGDWEVDRNTIKRRLDGQSNHISLVGYEFVKEKDPEIRKAGKSGKVYYLTTKGFLAAFSTGLSFERMDIFKKYTKFLDEILKRKIKNIGIDAGFDSSLDDETQQKMLDIITRYIKYQILVFLIWHEANETSIRKKRNSSWYIEEFFKNHNEFIHQEFPMRLEEKLENEVGAFRLHDLRHNVVSWDVSRGVALEIAGKNVGHRSRQATEIYAHFAPDALKRAADERARAMRMAVEGTRQSVDP